MKKRLLWCILLPFFLLSLVQCSSTTAQGKRSAGPQSSGNLLEEARNLVIQASPDSLNHALSLLQNTPEGASEAGTELSALAAFLLRTVYPLAARSGGITPSGGSQWAQIFRSVESGQIPQLPPENVSFFTSLISSAAILFSNSPQVWAQGEEILGQLLALNSPSVLPVYLYGFLLDKRENLPQAEEYYRRAVEMAPSCYPGELGIAWIQIRRGEPQAALVNLNRLNGLYPGQPEILRYIGEAYLAMGSYEQALNYVTDALLTVPDDTALLFLRAKILEKLGRLDQARRILSIVERTLPNDPDILLLRARLDMNEGNYTSAASVLRRAMELYPQRTDIQNLYGELLIKTGDTQGGREILNRQLESGAGSLANLELLLKDAVASRLWQEADGYSDRILEQRRDLEDLLRAREIALALNNSAKTQTLEEELFQRFPLDPQVETIRIRSLIQKGQLIQAREIIQAAIQSAGTFSRRSTLYYLLSLTLTNENEKIEALRNALLEDLENKDALVELARIYTGRRDYRNALRYMRQAAILDPGDPDIQRELRDLERRVQ